MFNLFKRKNKIKELECRVAVLETQVTDLNTPKDKRIRFDNPTINITADGSLYVEGGVIKKSNAEGCKSSCRNCDKEAIVPLKDTEFIDKLAKELVSAIEKNKESNSDKHTGELILQIDGAVIGKVALDQLNKMQRQSKAIIV